MNRNKLKAYAPQARRDFIKAVTDRAAFYGLTKDNTDPITEQGDVAIIAGKPFPRAVAAKRKRLEERIRRQGFEQVMEAMAYTWFNRFVAIRFMEIHGYLDHGYRVLNHPEGSAAPEIVEHAEHVDLPGLDRERVIELKLAGNKDEELYRMLLIAQCNALHKAMPFLFEWINDATELLLPENLLHSDSLIRKLVNEIPEEDWREVEIIGWLYQFYISEKKDQVIGKVVKSEDIPAATQLFTPNWIVKYMVQNTLGRQWMATYPNSLLKQQMEFYIEPAEQTPEVQEQLKAITPDSINPEELTLLDPACGSGHILVEAYDLLRAIYQERGYRKKDIPRLILEKNLYGLEIDDRSAQLAAFALMMKARADDRHIFENGTQPHVLAIQESKGLDAGKMTEALNEPILKVELLPREFLFEEMEEERAPLFSRKRLSIKGEISQADVAQLIDLFEHGKTFGSLIRVPEEVAEKLPAIAERVKDVLAYGEMFGKAVARSLEPILEQSRILVGSYDAIVTNPPYMGSGAMNPTLRRFAAKQYPDSKADLYAMFIQRNLQLLKDGRYLGMITMQSWMFIGTYRVFRKSLTLKSGFVNMLHLGPNAFDTISGEVVQTTAFVLMNTHVKSKKAVFLCLISGKNEEEKRMLLKGSTERYSICPDQFSRIPDAPFAYWVSDTVRNIFENSLPLKDVAEPRIGLQTGDNERFIRHWYEVAVTNTSLRDVHSYQSAIDRGAKWFPHDKGGANLKWYTDTYFVVNWKNDGQAITKDKAIRLEKGLIEKKNSECWNRNYYFREGATWTRMASGSFCVRFRPVGYVFDTASPTIFTERNRLYALLGFLNSNLASSFAGILNPTLSFQSGDLKRLPILLTNASQRLAGIVEELIELSKSDSSSIETSFGFQEFPMLRKETKCLYLKETYEKWVYDCEKKIDRIKEFEEENNSLFIEAYGLQDEFSPDVPEDKITLSRPDLAEDIKRLISYTAGCMMGRYSLNKPGLIYAHSGNNGFDPSQYRIFPADQDGIIPITATDWFEDDAANRVIEFIGVAWPKEHLEENLKFVAASLSPKREESFQDTIRRYLTTGFYKHHMKMYKKRPIYWLFSSGKQRAFQCLVYLHRYNAGTLSRMRTEYVIPLQGKMSARIDQLKDDITAAASTSHRKKLERERDKLVKQQAELQAFDEKLRHYADKRISLDLDDGVKVNYGKFGDLLAEVKAVTGKKAE